MDDILEKVKKGKTQIMTEHLNTINPTGNIKFTHEEEECSLAFLDVKVCHIDDGSILTLVIRTSNSTQNVCHKIVDGQSSFGNNL